MNWGSVSRSKKGEEEMAYRTRGGRSRSSYGGRARAGSRGRGGRAGPARARRTSARQSPGVLRIVIEQQGNSPVSRYPGIAAKMNPPAKKAKF